MLGADKNVRRPKKMLGAPEWSFQTFFFAKLKV